MTIKALTISQPYASTIADGEKWIENRRWSTSYRGPLAIHAGKGTQYLSTSELRRYQTGCVLAVAELVACVPFEVLQDRTCRWAELAYVGISVDDVRHNEHAEGPFCWILSDVRKLVNACPCNGSQGLWDWRTTDRIEFVERSQ